MRSLFFVLLLLGIVFSSCSKYYSYDIRITSPIASKALFFENDTFSISFEFRTDAIFFEIYNKLDDGIRLNWDELSLSINGKASRIIHKETGTTKIYDVQPPTTIPPKSKLQDLFYTTDNLSVSLTRAGAIANTSILFPTSDYGNKKRSKFINSLKGQNIVIYFPYYLRGVYFSKTFIFNVFDVKRLKNYSEYVKQRDK